MISEINILQNDFEEKKSCKVIRREKILALKKISFMAYNAGKKILHRCVSGKRFKLQRFGKKENLTQTKSPIQATPHPHLFRNQMVGPQKVTILLRPSIIATLTKKKIIFAFYSYYNQKNRRKRVETSHSSADQNTFCIYCFLFFI